MTVRLNDATRGCVRRRVCRLCGVYVVGFPSRSFFLFVLFFKVCSAQNVILLYTCVVGRFLFSFLQTSV